MGLVDGHPALLWIWGTAQVLLTAIYAWATIAFGLRFSNLTYRGVLTNGPYAFTRHPAYLSKNLFWWLVTLPFLATTHSKVDAVRNTVTLALVSAVYFWRAKTEEKHLLGEDAKYRAYHAWMAEHGLITRPLARLGQLVVGRSAPGVHPLDPSSEGRGKA
jgi:protein-S-isoprenylcysteine O-methyltransferase Ste14